MNEELAAELLRRKDADLALRDELAGDEEII
jgi:hypothetical protein